MSERTLMLLGVLAGDAIGIYSALTYVERATLWQLALMDESGVVKPLRVRRVGSNKFNPTYEVEPRDFGRPATIGFGIVQKGGDRETAALGQGVPAVLRDAR